MSENYKSVYAAGAENGLVLGPLMSVALLLTGASAYNMLYFLPALAAIFAVPVAAYVMLARACRLRPAASTFSALWLQGICMFFFGGLLMALVAYVSLRWIWPSYIIDQMNNVISVYSSVGDPTAADVASTLKKMIETKTVPTAIDIALELIYVAVFTGSLLSMALSALARALNRSPRPPKFPNQ